MNGGSLFINVIGHDYVDFLKYEQMFKKTNKFKYMFSLLTINKQVKVSQKCN